jgi:copper(I)-binding protein
MIKKLLLALVLLCFFVSSASAHSYRTGQIFIGHPMMDIQSGCLMMSFLNKGSQDDALTNIESKNGEKIIIFDRAQNIALDKLAIPSEKPFALKLNTQCLIFKEKAPNVVVSDEFRIKLSFEKAAPVYVDIHVEGSAHPAH